MNIFFLDKDPKKAAEYHVDKHVVKMILETAQLLSTAHHCCNSSKEELYKATHINHPCSKWVRQSKANYNWTYQLFYHLCNEYTLRYGKIHKTDTKLREVLSETPNISDTEFTSPAQAMPDYCKNEDPVVAYRTYYIKEKHRFATWKFRNKPNWFSNS